MKTQLLENINITYIKNGGPEFIQFNNLKRYGEEIIHCFTTRLGGMSSGECSSLNMGFNKNDSRENVMDNYLMLSENLGIDCKDMVFSNQVHDSKIKIVDESDRGKGICRESDIKGYDGLVTNKKGVALVTFYADCVPVFFYDFHKKVIALCHSGWRGTVKEIAKETVGAMTREYGCSPEDVEAAIGPSIGPCCFEVGAEVYGEFKSRAEWSQKYCNKTMDSKWYINLQGIIKDTLLNSGINEKRICVSGVCTKCNKDVFFSHRGDKGKTGSLAAVMQLR